MKTPVTLPPASLMLNVSCKMAFPCADVYQASNCYLCKGPASTSMSARPPPLPVGLVQCVKMLLAPSGAFALQALLVTHPGEAVLAAW